MAKNDIHPSAIVDAGAELNGVKVGAFCVVEKDVTIDEGTELSYGTIVKSNTVIGKNNSIAEHVVLGGMPQDISYSPETQTGLVIGDNNVIREMVTAHRATVEGTNTRIGNNNFIMAQNHFAHDCIVHDNIIMANNCGLAGFVEIFSGAVLSAFCGFHQFIKVGSYVMISAMTKASVDIPPFCVVDGLWANFRTINAIGLRRAGFSSEERQQIKRYYKVVYDKHSNIKDAIAELESMELDKNGQMILDFIRSSKRGIIPKGSKNRG